MSDNKRVFGSLEFDSSRIIAFWKGELLDLSLTQYWILNELASNAGEVKDYSKLMRAAKICVEPNTISAHIKTIRARIRSLDAGFNCIKTERGVGYRWVEV